MTVGLGVSVLLHVVLLLFYASYATRSREPVPTIYIDAVPPAEAELAGIRALRVVEVSTPEPGDPAEPDPIREVEEAVVDVEVPEFADDPPIFVPERYRSAVERLRVSEGDPRLWAPIPPELLEASDDAILRARLAILIAEGNDSIRAEAEALERAMDWTYTDDDGKRWGLSPGMIHLGDIAIPLPFGFGAPYDYNGDRAEMAFRINDLQRAAGALAARQSWRERAEAMRKRREERRADDQAARAGSGTVVKPDTTSRGRQPG